MEPIIEVKGLKKYFQTPRGLLHAVDDVTFSIERGKTLGVVGESGCGKSTLGRTIIHLLESTGGQIFLEGKDITNVKGKELKQVREKMQIFSRIHILHWIPENQWMQPSVNHWW